MTKNKFYTLDKAEKEAIFMPSVAKPECQPLLLKKTGGLYKHWQ